MGRLDLGKDTLCNLHVSPMQARDVPLLTVPPDQVAKDGAEREGNGGYLVEEEIYE